MRQASLKTLFWLGLAIFSPIAFGQAVEVESSASKPLQNQLADNPSPYLKLHANDPTMWQEWGKDVIERAKKENKLIFLSSGYFSCHWCHVMQQESYQNDDVAALLNANFIPVKIDRELEPALDGRLMDYAQATLKRGGWPLNVFISPDGIEVLAILYQPQPQFKKLLTQISGVWDQQSERISKLAEEERVMANFPDAEPMLDPKVTTELAEKVSQFILRRMDDLEGGFGGSNKFPSSPQLFFLLHHFERTGNPQIKENLEFTLDAMAKNGLVDHLEGGFFRYSVDPGWQIPHFEKMLYNNANLSKLYLQAADILNRPDYKAVAKQTLDFMLSKMLDKKEKAFYAAFSAVDNNSVEGGYYLWEPDQIRSALGEEAFKIFDAAWHINFPNELDAGNHLRLQTKLSTLVEPLGMTESEIQVSVESSRLKLIKEREKRVLPVDNKLLAGWNSLALSTLLEASQKWGVDKDGSGEGAKYLQAAQNLQVFLLGKLWDGKLLKRGYANGEFAGSASLQDYAYFAAAQVQWAKFSKTQIDIDRVDTLLQTAWSKFYAGNAWLDTDSSLLPPVSGSEIITDGAMPSPASVLLGATLAYANLEGAKQKVKWRDKALSALNRGQEGIARTAYWYATQADVMAKFVAGK